MLGIISGIASGLGSILGASSARKAAKTQADAANRATAQEQAQYQQNRQDMAPWRQAGGASLGQLSDLLGLNTAPGGMGPTQRGPEFGALNKRFSLADFQAEPGYQFRMTEGLKGVNASAAARGGALSGGALKAIQQYGQDVASNEYGNAYSRYNADQDRRYNRLASLAGLGQTATTETGRQGLATAQSTSGNMIGAGNARASGYVGQANAITGGIDSLSSLYASGAFNRPTFQTGGGYGSVSGGYAPGANNPSAYIPPVD